MWFQTRNGLQMEGRLVEGASLLLRDEHGQSWRPEEVAFVVADDYEMQEAARAAGYPVHTPLTINLEEGSHA